MRWEIYLIFLLVILILGCTGQHSNEIAINETLEELQEPIECKNEIFKPLGGIIENYVGIQEGESKNLTYIFYSGSEDGELSLSIHRVSKFFETEYLEMPEGVKIRIEPSEINVKPNHTYKLNVILKSSDLPEVYYESYDGGKIKSEKFVFLVQAKLNNKTINDWFEVEVNPAGNIVIPGKSQLIACSIPSVEHVNSITVRKGEVLHMPLKFYPRKEIPGAVTLTAFMVKNVGDFERTDSKGISVDVEPSCLLPEEDPICITYNTSTIAVDVGQDVTPGKYVFCIFVDYKGGILTASWLTVHVNSEMQAVPYSVPELSTRVHQK